MRKFPRRETTAGFLSAPSLWDLVILTDRATAPRVDGAYAQPCLCVTMLRAACLTRQGLHVRRLESVVSAGFSTLDELYENYARLIVRSRRSPSKRWNAKTPIVLLWLNTYGLSRWRSTGPSCTSGNDIEGFGRGATASVENRCAEQVVACGPPRSPRRYEPDVVQDLPCRKFCLPAIIRWKGNCYPSGPTVTLFGPRDRVSGIMEG